MADTEKEKSVPPAVCTCWQGKTRKPELCDACASFGANRARLDPFYAGVRRERYLADIARKSAK